MNDLERLMQKIRAIELRLENVIAQSSVGQVSPDTSVYQLDYTHQHPLRNISNLSKLAGTLLIYSSEVLSVDEANIDHDALTNFSSTEHFTMLDQDNLGDNDDTKAATQQSIKAYVDANIGDLTNLDGGVSDSNYGAIDQSPLDGGDATSF